jgi:hypothetical protein
MVLEAETTDEIFCRPLSDIVQWKVFQKTITIDFADQSEDYIPYEPHTVSQVKVFVHQIHVKGVGRLRVIWSNSTKETRDIRVPSWKSDILYHPQGQRIVSKVVITFCILF